MNWKEQFDYDFNYKKRPTYFDLYGVDIKEYIETEIIEKLIDEIPSQGTYVRYSPKGQGPMTTELSHFKQHLRNKWL